MTSLTVTNDGTPRIECYCRVDEPAAAEWVAEIQSRLSRLVSAGYIDGLAVRPWTRRLVESADTEPAGTVHATVNAFEQWADQTGHSLAPAFERRTVASAIAGTSREILVLPIVCLATYVDGELVDVVPCSRGGDTRSVEEYLDSLERGRNSRIVYPAD